MDTHASMELVELDRDHPGFRDPVYRARRNAIARVAMEYRPGEPVPDTPYTTVEHGVWRHVWDHLRPVHRRKACGRYRAALAQLELPTETIPQLSEVNEQLVGTFQLQPVAGLVTPQRFLTGLAQGVFYSTQYVRHHGTPLYTPEPDVIHELVGHAPLLQDPLFAEVNRAFGRAAQRSGPVQMEALIRLYWYTVEFGVVREEGAIKAYGAGLLSSFGELERIDTAPELRPFDVARIAVTDYDPTDYQPVLFLAEDLDQALTTLVTYLEQV